MLQQLGAGEHPMAADEPIDHLATTDQAAQAS
jgi:hypothetical protein